MGYGSWSPSDWTGYASKTASMDRSTIFKSRSMDEYLNPLQFKMRESRDSDANPKSTPIIIACDVTGSMGILAETIVKKDLGTIMGEIINRKPVTDPHVLLAAIGDTYCDTAPFQATQFEAENVLTDQIEKFYLEGGGGGNSGESYIGAWYFAAFRTECDAIIKRDKKGYLFTIGDEAPLDTLTKEHIKEFFGDGVEADMTAQGLLDVVRQHWNVFHVMIKPVTYQNVEARWRDLLGQNLLKADDHQHIGEIIISAIQVMEGEAVDAVANSWSGDTSIAVRKAITDLDRAGSKSTADHGVVAL